MNALPNRRFHKLHEQVLLSPWFSLALGWLASVALPLALYWKWIPNPTTMTQGQKTAIIVTSIAFVLAYLAVKRLRATYPGGRLGFFIAPQIIVTYAVLALIVLLLRIEISRLILVASGLAALAWFHVEHIATFRFRRPKIAVIPGGEADLLLTLPDLDARSIPDHDILNTRYDAVVADFDHINDADERFLTACALDRLAVYNAKTIYESFTGRVRIHRMSENNIGSLLPSPTYERVKATMDCMIVICSLPVVLPLCALTALCIKLESSGPVIYSQARVGRGNKRFTIYKFRSMRVDGSQAQRFADKEDDRVTRVGRIIRKLRIDELPQFFNIIRGEMSLIGPRPEQPAFVEDFNRKIPFYSYRHVVKPGITGWAQVRQGYAANADDTQVKIEHDFYYIKNCSFYLDTLVVLLTIKTMLTGFGAR